MRNTFKSFSLYVALKIPIWASDRQVVRIVRRNLPTCQRADPASRASRRRAYEAMLAHHRAARKLWGEGRYDCD